MTEFREGDVSPDIREPEFSEEWIARYVEGCSEVALTLHTVVENVRSAGKKPIVLIPSRGAVPIFLIANEVLRRMDSTHTLLDPKRVSYYPRKIFEVLSQDRINKISDGQDITANPPVSEIDVVLYPFTADVSLEMNGEEWLARKLRDSCSKAVYDLVFKTDQYPEDLGWYYFLMSKLKKDSQCSPKLNPDEIVRALKDYPGAENGQIILIDTVISGRAAQDIVTSFASLGHKVAPVLAVDTTGGGHFQKVREAEINRSIAWEFIGDQTPFIHFPLITEDKGASVLGVSAINFANFNQARFFHDNDKRFKPDFMPQSCIWTLPPGSNCEYSLSTFHQFIELATKKAGHEVLGDIADFRGRLLPLIHTHAAPDDKDLRATIRTDNGLTAKETASHIISLWLSEKQAQEWVKEFANFLASKPR